MNIGEILKLISKIISVIGIFVCILAGVALGGETPIIGILVWILGSIFSCFNGAVLYAFGEVIISLKEIRDKLSVQNSDNINQEENKIYPLMETAKTVKKTDEIKVPYWCSKCGKEGPYIGNCPVCGNATIRHND